MVIRIKETEQADLTFSFCTIICSVDLMMANEELLTLVYRVILPRDLYKNLPMAQPCARDEDDIDLVYFSWDVKS